MFVCIGSTIGKVAQTVEISTTNQQINAVVPNDDYDDNLIFTVLETKADKVKAVASNQAVPIVNKTTFGNMDVVIPNSKKEQMLLGIFFYHIDNLIALHQRGVIVLLN